jgi:hypothetical protein
MKQKFRDFISHNNKFVSDPNNTTERKQCGIVFFPVQDMPIQCTQWAYHVRSQYYTTLMNCNAAAAL